MLIVCELSSFVFVQAAQVVQAARSDAEDAKTTHKHPIYTYIYRLIDALSRHLINKLK